MYRLYHELTSYKSGDDFPAEPAEHPLVSQDFVANDFARWPWPCKRYGHDLPRVELPREWAAGELDALARLLFLSAGVVRVVERPERPTLLLRAAGSAGARFPLELYVSALGAGGLEDGVYWYDPVGHALVRIGPPAGGSVTTLVVTGVPWRTGWRYSERGFRHVYWDAGTLLSQALALAAPQGRLRSRFPDTAVAELVGADGVHEWPVALMSLGDGEPAIRASGPAAAGDVDAAPLEFPLVTAAQRAGDGGELGAPWPVGGPLDLPRPLEDVILRRGSTRRMDASATVPRAVFERCLAVALRGIAVPHFVAVHGVDDVAPGLYRWPALLRGGNLREELLRACWDQDLGRDAAFVVIGAVDLAGLSDRRYREAQLAAGIVEGRLHLAAYASGIGASGMTFLDSSIEGLLGAPLAGLLFTCVGVPAYRNRGGGRPGAPVPVVVPTPGLTLPDA